MPLLKCISVPSSQNLFKIATKTQFANTKFELTILHIPRSFPFIYEKILSNSRKLYMVFAVVELLLLFYETTNFKMEHKSVFQQKIVGVNAKLKAKCDDSNGNCEFLIILSYVTLRDMRTLLAISISISTAVRCTNE